ncbi:MAG: glycosyltransferase family 4 protein [Candidatus Sulfotelmatobacter sp.]|jgi:glycosyltransferase involved in cell wall biosynthesis
MLTIAYLANQFPCAVEPYVGEEIEELRRRGIRVVTGSVRKPPAGAEAPEIVLQRLSGVIAVRAAWLCMRRWRRMIPLIGRALLGGRENPWRRLKALAHTFLGACYAVQLEDREVDQIHAHHGYFGSWIAMAAARLMDVGFSMTLHGSDLLLHGTFLDVKLEQCTFCLTVSEYNRRYILQNYPEVEPRKVSVARLGVDVPWLSVSHPFAAKPRGELFTLLAVGRLHAVKNHAFLVQACAQLQALDISFECFIAGGGPERGRLESLIRKHGLEGQVTLLGHIPREQMDSLYERADVVVLTSHSEGIPLVLMEAMARRRIVLAPAITGIPELVVAGRTGFLYEPESMEDFIDQLLLVHSLFRAERSSEERHSYPHLRSASKLAEWVRFGALVQVRNNFNRETNLELFGDLMLQRIAARPESVAHENFVLQQI